MKEEVAANGGERLGESAWKHLIVSRDGPTVEVELHRPSARNALNAAIIKELTEVARLLRRRSDVLAVILAGGETNFSAGADLSAGEADAAVGPSKVPTLLEAREELMTGPDLCRAWEEIEAVTIAAIEGYCLGGGCAIAMACDFRIMAEGAYMRLPEIPLGMNMSWNSVPRITTLVGPSRAKRFVILGEAVDAETCVGWGMADEVTKKGEARAVSRAWAAKVSTLPPIPVRMTKEAINAQATATHLISSFADRDQFLLTSRTEDYKEGIAAFLEKRKPAFRGN
ncbi:enoyl-CoA hydratase/isomerase family protein [Bradyrhizobium sp. 38]|uniref:enoyl-CoA hydratase/isomerase family protein n=1 Tax=Bradyrhizobium sp. 38 TaxID=2782672 RepID=UPI001FF72078|nr:enoyl-CoA hydratase/isomerase family protein [Bradyrhizobium sp. 38]MCK1336685.1 enoyl-CoA hydratase/isomerase family protein [Bradyrhizobium sp. 38]